MSHINSHKDHIAAFKFIMELILWGCNSVIPIHMYEPDKLGNLKMKNKKKCYIRTRNSSSLNSINKQYPLN